MRGEIWLGDLLTAVVAETPAGQPPDRDTVHAVARLLGLVPPEGHVQPGGVQQPRPEPVTEAPETGSAEATTVDSGVPLGESPPAPEDKPPPERQKPATDPGEPLTEQRTAGLRTSWVEDDDTTEPPWMSAISLDRPTENERRIPLPHTPLLPPRQAAAIIQAALVRWVPNGDVDVPAVVESLARLRQVLTLPRLPVPTLRFGVQVLVDRAEPMHPFHRDQQALVKGILDVVGKDMMDVRFFAHSPLLGTGSGHRRGWTDYQPPAPGRPVVVLSGFGLRNERAANHRRPDWEHLVRLLHRQDSAVIAFVPFPARRWPTWLARLLPLVCWDRSATTAAVRVAREAFG